MQTVTRWVGTAPFCKATPADCAARDMRYHSSCSSCGPGSSCWSGQKVRCEHTTKTYKDECNPMCSPYYTKKWVGTAPACAGDECDCVATDSIPMEKKGGAGDCECGSQANCAPFGSGCWSGSKILCVRPKLHSAQRRLDNLLVTMKAECTERKRIDAESRVQMMRILGDVAVAAVSAKKGR